MKPAVEIDAATGRARFVAGAKMPPGGWTIPALADLLADFRRDLELAAAERPGIVFGDLSVHAGLIDDKGKPWPALIAVAFGTPRSAPSAALSAALPAKEAA
jgi:hypothetical protein